MKKKTAFSVFVGIFLVLGLPFAVNYTTAEASNDGDTTISFDSATVQAATSNYAIDQIEFAYRDSSGTQHSAALTSDGESIDLEDGSEVYSMVMDVSIDSDVWSGDISSGDGFKASFDFGTYTGTEVHASDRGDGIYRFSFQDLNVGGNYVTVNEGDTHTINTGFEVDCNQHTC